MKPARFDYETGKPLNVPRGVALALSIVPSMANYERMASHVNNTAWRIRQANGDIYTDRRFNRVLQFQCAMGIVVKSPTYASDVFRFYNAVAGFLLRLDSDQLKTMPEHMVSDACAVLDFASGHTVGLLSGIDFGNSFRLTVKLLSKDKQVLQYLFISFTKQC